MLRPHISRVRPHISRVRPHISRVRPYISRVRPYISRLRPHIGCSPAHPASRQHCLRRSPELRFMLFWERSLGETDRKA